MMEVEEHSDSPESPTSSLSSSSSPSAVAASSSSSSSSSSSAAAASAAAVASSSSSSSSAAAAAPVSNTTISSAFTYVPTLLQDETFIDVQHIREPVVSISEDILELQQLRANLELIIKSSSPIIMYDRKDNVTRKTLQNEVENIAADLIGPSYNTNWKVVINHVAYVYR